MRLVVPVAVIVALSGCVFGGPSFEAGDDGLLWALTTDPADGDCPVPTVFTALGWQQYPTVGAEGTARMGFDPTGTDAGVGACTWDDATFACWPFGQRLDDQRWVEIRVGGDVRDDLHWAGEAALTGTCGEACGDVHGLTDPIWCEGAVGFALERLQDPVMRGADRDGPGCDRPMTSDDGGGFAALNLVSNTATSLAVVSIASDGTRTRLEDGLNPGAVLSVSTTIGAVYELVADDPIDGEVCVGRVRVDGDGQLFAIDGRQR